MKKRRLWLFAVLPLLTAGVLASCTNNEPDNPVISTYGITWDVPEHVTVKVDGNSTLPETFEKGQTLKFTVEAETNYVVSSVKQNNKKLTAKDGVYSAIINADTTISIELAEEIKDVTIKSNPTKLKYFAGDAIDLTGLVVEAEYKTGTKKELQFGGTDGYSVSPSTFQGGETEITIYYGDIEKKIPLEDRVEYLVTFDTNGGTLSQDYITYIEGLGLKNYSFENGVLTFSYFTDLEGTINLPTSDQISRENYTFVSFDGTQDVKSITKSTKKSLTITTAWQPKLVIFNEVKLALENETPYLIITGKFNLVDTAYLFLYEGNKDISLEGPTIQNENEDGSFELKFDLTELSKLGGDYVGAWMDIRIATTVDGKESYMDVNLSDSSITVDMSQTLKTNGYTYNFAEYNGLLKVYFQVYEYSWNVSIDETNETFTINGQFFNENYSNKYIYFSWYDSSESHGKGALMDETGKFSVTYSLSEFNVRDTNVFAHVGIYETEDTTTTPIFGGTNTNLLISNSETVFPSITQGEAGDDMKNAFSFVAKDGVTYYVGYAWDGLMVYAKSAPESRFEIKNYDLKISENKVLFEISGTYTISDEEFKALPYVLNFQQNQNAGASGWDYPFNYTNEAQAGLVSWTIGNGLFAVDVDITNLPNDIMTVHFGIDTDNGDADCKLGFEDSKSVELNGKVYSTVIVPNDTSGVGFWGNIGLTIADK